jgi:hypothetical protein
MKDFLWNGCNLQPLVKSVFDSELYVMAALEYWLFGSSWEKSHVLYLLWTL